MLGLKLNHVSKRGHRGPQQNKACTHELKLTFVDVAIWHLNDQVLGAFRQEDFRPFIWIICRWCVTIPQMLRIFQNPSYPLVWEVRWACVRPQGVCLWVLSEAGHPAVRAGGSPVPLAGALRLGRPFDWGGQRLRLHPNFRVHTALLGGMVGLLKSGQISALGAVCPGLSTGLGGARRGPGGICTAGDIRAMLLQWVSGHIGMGQCSAGWGAGPPQHIPVVLTRPVGHDKTHISARGTHRRLAARVDKRQGGCLWNSVFDFFNMVKFLQNTHNRCSQVFCECELSCVHDEVIKWQHFPHYWTFGQGIHRWLVNSPHKGQWRGALLFSLIRAWTNSWAKQWRRRWFEMPSCSLWRHSNDFATLISCGLGQHVYESVFVCKKIYSTWVQCHVKMQNAHNKWPIGWLLV